MSYKTPAEIAEECALAIVKTHGQSQEIEPGVKNPGIVTLAWCLGGPIEYETGLVELVARAIEADREQRAADSIVLTDAASKWATELTDYVIPSAGESDAADAKAYQAERDEIQRALGRHLADSPEVATAPVCKNCDETIEDDDVHAGGDMCGSCNHNAARSGA